MLSPALELGSAAAGGLETSLREGSFEVEQSGF